MGLSCIELDFYARLFTAGLITDGGDVLEFGESECVGEPIELLDRFEHIFAAGEIEAARQAIMDAAQSTSRYQRRYGSARALYAMIFDPASYTSLDISPGARRIWVDLNRPFKLGRVYDYCINNGTSEHVFNQANVFKAIHDHTKVRGLMIHWTPTLGWTNHGMYNVQPGFFYDLTVANNYQVEHMELGAPDAMQALPSRNAYMQALMAEPKLRESLLCVALRKMTDEPFMMPMQEMWAIENLGAPPFIRAASRTSAGGSPRKDRPNLALGMPANQSSTSEFSWHDDPTVDARGGNNGVVTGSYGFHTDLEDRPWWSVDLTHPEPIHEIVVYNRLEGFGTSNRAGRLFIAASQDNGRWNTLAAFPSGISFGGADGHPLRLTFNETVLARYVKVGLLDRNHLHLDEIEIY